MLGVGARLAFNARFPVQPFWDFLQLVHFGVLLRDQGLTASGWYWGQFNAGLPSILSLLFRVVGRDPIAAARTVTAVATGLLSLLPLFLWRPVVALRWRFLAGALLALWPGQIFFSGVIAQDNWVLLPTIALASLAVRRLLDRADAGHPVLAGLLYACAFAIRQEMVIVLLPLAVAAAAKRRPSFRRNLAAFGLTVGLALLLLAGQRFMATRRLAITTEHGALGLFGSFVPGSSFQGWIDARAYAAALEPTVMKDPYGTQRVLLRLTWAEARRRPLFHLLRIASWVPRLALNADSDNLFWSVGAPRAQAAALRTRAASVAERWKPRLKLELALIQGLFAATAVLGLRRRDPAILLLTTAVLLKFMIHAVVSPLGRLVVPAIALQLLTIPLGAAALGTQRVKERVAMALLAAGAVALLFVGTPKLEAFVTRRDSIVLPGVSRFTLPAGTECDVRCRLEAGSVTGLAPTWARIQTTDSAKSAALACELPVLDPGDSLILRLDDPNAQVALPGRSVVQVEIDGREIMTRDLAANPIPGPVRIALPAGDHPSTLTVRINTLRDLADQDSANPFMTLAFETPEMSRSASE